ncbi:helix-turn-helix domain-containing protein [Neobacillus sp. OS1-2]|uniref:helix-turn-helix domain-containing protein n=1 Tax=Neobacillus sp. OS1-2 TaxID=3070680 RepID=UPI0035A62811
MHHKILVGKVIRKKRVSLKISQLVLAERSSLSPIMISKFERNLSEPSFETTIKLAAAFGMKASEFIKEIEDTIDRDQHL